MEPKYPEIEVHLTGQDGNAFAILARVTRAMRHAGISDEERDAFYAEDTRRSSLKWLRNHANTSTGYGPSIPHGCKGVSAACLRTFASCSAAGLYSEAARLGYPLPRFPPHPRPKRPDSAQHYCGAKFSNEPRKDWCSPFPSRTRLQTSAMSTSLQLGRSLSGTVRFTTSNRW